MLLLVILNSVVVEMESLFSTPMPSFLETPSRIQSADQKELTEIAYEMNLIKTSTAERIDKIECLIWENVMGHDTSQNRKYVTARVVPK